MSNLSALQNIWAVLSGLSIGFLLALAGGSGSALAVPLMIYVVGIKVPRLAIGTTSVAVAVTALLGAVPYGRGGHVNWPIAVAFSGPGLLGVWWGGHLGRSLPSSLLLSCLGILLLVNAVIMVSLPSSTLEDRPTWTNRLPFWAKIGPLGFLVGMLAGLFGTGGGSLALPGMMATGMPMVAAIGSSLVSVGSLSTANALDFILRGSVDWRVVLDYVAGGLLGSWAGSRFALRWASRGRLLQSFVVLLLVGVSFYLLGQNGASLFTG